MIDVDALKAMIKAALREVLDERDTSTPATENTSGRYSPRQAAEYLSCSVKTLLRYHRKGLLPAVDHVGRSPRFSKETIQNFNTEKPGSPIDHDRAVERHLQAVERRRAGGAR